MFAHHLQSIGRTCTRAAAASFLLHHHCNNELSSRCEAPKQEPVLKTKTDDISQNDKTNEFYHGSAYPVDMVRVPNKLYPLWDDDWDGLAPAKGGEKGISNREIRKKGTTRHIILVRHGQYYEEKDETKRILTPLGREQAALTGKRLAEMVKGIDEKFGSCNVKIIRVSGMIRAIETAEIIAKNLPGVECSDPDPDLNEGR